MRVLIIKTSSMGDIIHTFPALTDAGTVIPGITFDWVVEEGFADIPAWHPLVNQVIPVGLRRWRKHLLSRKTWSDLKTLRKRLQAKDYDLIIDAQGLLKSAWIAFFAKKAKRSGLDFQSARESLASFCYQQKYRVDFYQQAVLRMRSLFSQALGYEIPYQEPNFGLNKALFKQSIHQNYLVFLHGTTWKSKEWPEIYWKQLAALAAQAGYFIKVSGGSAAEIESADRIAKSHAEIEAIPRLTIPEMAALLAHAQAVVTVDTGFGHLAAALDVPTVSLFGPTSAAYNGAIGQRSRHVSADFACSPCLKRVCHYEGASIVKPACFQTIPPYRVWQAVKEIL